MKKHIIKSLSVTGIAVCSLLPFANPAKAGWGYQTWEHPVTTFSGSLSQASADSLCRSYVYNRIDYYGGNFYDMEHSYWMAFAKFSRPYVWAHLNNRHCVINASWGYFRY